MSDSEYISLKDISIRSVDEYFDKDLELDESGEPVYQIQSELLDNSISSSRTCIMKVGLFLKTPTVLIHKFDLTPKVRCLVVSELYSESDIITAAAVCRFNMIKLVVNFIKSKNDDTLVPIGCILLSFNTFDHKVKKKSIMEYVSSNKDSIQELNGFWTVSFHFKNKMIVLEKYKSYQGTQQMIDNMIKHIADKDVRDIIDQLVKDVS